jgi:hypothetical protein
MALVHDVNARIAQGLEPRTVNIPSNSVATIIIWDTDQWYISEEVDGPDSVLLDDNALLVYATPQQISPILKSFAPLSSSYGLGMSTHLDNLDAVTDGLKRVINNLSSARPGITTDLIRSRHPTDISQKLRDIESDLQRRLLDIQSIAQDLREI